MKGRCCPKIVVSIPRSLFTSGQLRHIGGIVPKTALPLWRKACEKMEVDIISRYRWWINEELHRWSFDKPLKIVYHWYLKYFLTQTFFLVIAQWRFHSTWSTISFPKIRRKKNINWNFISTFQRNMSLSLEELSRVYTIRDATRRDATRSHDWVPMKATGPFTLCTTRRDGTRLRRPNWLLYPNNRAESRSKRDSLGFRHQRNPFPRIVTRLTRLV